jgi:hypothetical protein
MAGELSGPDSEVTELPSLPIRRRVALKRIKHGMDSREVVARFTSERQAPALMDHPNIAQVFDADATSEAVRTSPWNGSTGVASPISATHIA